MKDVRKVMKVATILLYATAFLFPLSFSAQSDQGVKTAKDLVYGEPGIDVLYTHTKGISAFLHTQGAGMNFRYGKYSTAKSSTSFAFDLHYTKDLREELSSNPYYIDALPYVLGKVHSMFSMRFCYEKRKEITPKHRKGAVQVGWLHRYGAVLGFLKPVYLNIGIGQLPYEDIITDEYNPEEHFNSDIVGRAAWVNGLDDLSVVPGGHLGCGLTFEYGSSRGQTQCLEVGAFADIYMSKMEIMSIEFVEPKRAFIALYVKLELGSNWTHGG